MEDIKECMREIGDAVSSLKRKVKTGERTRWVERVDSLVPQSADGWTTETAEELQRLALSMEEWGESIRESAERLRYAAEEIEEALKSP